jgi:hypothetical protein
MHLTQSSTSKNEEEANPNDLSQYFEEKASMILNKDSQLLNKSDFSIYSKTINDLQSGEKGKHFYHFEPNPPNECKFEKKDKKRKKKRKKKSNISSINDLKGLKKKKDQYISKLKILKNPNRKLFSNLNSKKTLKKKAALKNKIKSSRGLKKDISKGLLSKDYKQLAFLSNRNNEITPNPTFTSNPENQINNPKKEISKLQRYLKKLRSKRSIGKVARIKRKTVNFPSMRNVNRQNTKDQKPLSNAIRSIFIIFSPILHNLF